MLRAVAKLPCAASAASSPFDFIRRRRAS
jgi:hypothetical protein